MFCVVTEETTRVIGERRLGLLREFGTRLAESQTTQDVWHAVEQSTLTDARDLPFTMAYLVGDDETTATLAASSNVGVGQSRRAARRFTIDTPMWPIGAMLEGRDAAARFVDLDGDCLRGRAARGRRRPCAPWFCRSAAGAGCVRPGFSSPD